MNFFYKRKAVVIKKKYIGKQDVQICLENYYYKSQLITNIPRTSFILSKSNKLHGQETDLIFVRVHIQHGRKLKLNEIRTRLLSTHSQYPIQEIDGMHDSRFYLFPNVISLSIG